VRNCPILAIHPSKVQRANPVFSLGAAEVTKCKRILPEVLDP
jgi:citrate lyase beta subunit